MSKSCNAYCGVACVNGSCPNAHNDDFPEAIAIRVECEDCFLNKGCADCAWAGSGICDGDPDEEH